MRWTVARRRLYYPNQVFISKDNRRVQHQWLPRRLLLVRHGESAANVNREVYSNTPDWKIPLTPLGREQAYDCGKRLRSIIAEEKLYIYYSPYARTRQTLEEIRRSFDETQIQGEREDERLREQEMGNYQPMQDMDATWAARNAFGRLYYRFPFGESGADVGDRVSGFFDSLLRERIGLTVPNMNERLVQGAREELGCLGLGRWSADDVGAAVRGSDGAASSADRDGPAAAASPGSSAASAASAWEPLRHASPPHPLPVSDLGEAETRGVLPPNDLGASAGEEQNVLIVAHGLLIRLFIGRWFRVPMEVFETMCNPPNCAIIVLERDDRLGRLVMTDMSKSLFGSDPLLQMMRFDGREDTHWYRERFLGIVDPAKAAEEAVAEDDDENHYSHSNAHNIRVGAPAPPPPRRSKPPASFNTQPPPAGGASDGGASASSPSPVHPHPRSPVAPPTSASVGIDSTPNREYMKDHRDMPGSDATGATRT
ncbi:glycerolphosphate mutase [Novymonas esmeraldas]|uniref:Glycerolphosphate mutase n=1 Tax=Novymonas esmeraldas TaxID=1808958 RepID=A0AAW0F498_9TRYP